MAPVLIKSLSRLSRDSLLDLCLQWTKSSKCTPYLASNRKLHESEEEDYLHEPAESIADLKELYVSLKENSNDTDTFDLSKREIIDRVIDGDWRRGFSFQQLATLDFAYLEQNNTAMRWSALKLVPLRDDTSKENNQHPAKRRKVSKTTAHEEQYPQISPVRFLERLKAQVSPLVKAHYHIHRLPPPSNLAIIRLYIIPNTPFAPLNANIPRNTRSALDAARVIYIALPQSCPYVYVSVSGTSGNTKAKPGAKPDANKVDIAATKRIVLEAIPKALSKPQQRWSLETTKLTAKSLQSVISLRGGGKPGTSGGAYSKFCENQTLDACPHRDTGDSEKCQESNSINSCPTTVQRPALASLSTREAAVEHRFGNMNNTAHARLDRVHVSVRDILHNPVHTSTPNRPSSNRSSRKRRRRMTDIEDSDLSREEDESISEPAPIAITFSGTDIFKGLKLLTLQHPGYVDMEKLPAWMTGERNVSTLTV